MKNTQPGWAAVCLMVWLLTAATPSASAAIVYVSVPEARQSCLSAGAPLVCPFDIDGDGTNEFEVISGVNFSNFIRPLPAGAIVGNSELEVHPFLFGERIEQFTEGPLGMTSFPASFLLSFGFDGATGGAFYGRDAYFGFALVRNNFNDYYNGWFHIQEIAGFGPLMLEYAYQTEPNIPILAGQIPEPTTAAYIGGSAFLLWQRNAHTRKQNKALLPTPRGWLVSALHFIRKLLGFGGAHPRP